MALARCRDTSETSLEGWKLIKNPGCKIKINLPKLPLRDGNYVAVCKDNDEMYFRNFL